MSKVVMDASALLAVIFGEPGSDALVPLLPQAALSAVNLAEVHGILVRNGVPKQEAWKAASSLIHDVAKFDPGQARLAGDLMLETRSSGLSLGDRACLALAISLRVSVYTTDRAWKNLKLPIEVKVLRVP